jgi:hypothetical protein
MESIFNDKFVNVVYVNETLISHCGSFVLRDLIIAIAKHRLQHSDSCCNVQSRKNNFEFKSLAVLGQLK